MTTAATSGIFFGFFPPVFFCAAPRLFVGCPPSANNGTGAIGSLKHEDDAEDDDEEEEDDDEEENEGADTVAPPVEPGSLEDRSAPASRPTNSHWVKLCMLSWPSPGFSDEPFFKRFLAWVHRLRRSFLHSQLHLHLHSISFDFSLSCMLLRGLGFADLAFYDYSKVEPLLRPRKEQTWHGSSKLCCRASCQNPRFRDVARQKTLDFH